MHLHVIRELSRFVHLWRGPKFHPNHASFHPNLNSKIWLWLRYFKVRFLTKITKLKDCNVKESKRLLGARSTIRLTYIYRNRPLYRMVHIQLHLICFGIGKFWLCFFSRMFVRCRGVRLGAGAGEGTGRDSSVVILGSY